MFLRTFYLQRHLKVRNDIQDCNYNNKWAFEYLIHNCNHTNHLIYNMFKTNRNVISVNRVKNHHILDQFILYVHTLAYRALNPKLLLFICL